MKKLLFGLGAMTVLFSACNGNDDDNTSSTSTVLLKKMVEVGENDGEDYVTVFSYNGTKLTKIAVDSDVVNYTYTGDNITMAEWVSDGELLYRDLYTYNSDGSLASYTELDLEFNEGTKEVYTYNSDNTATVTTFTGDTTSQTEQGETGTITFLANGEVSQIVSDSGTTTYTYDAKNNPMKNITGYAKISFTGGSAFGMMHNVTSEVEDDFSTTYTYTYNSSDYPVTAVESDGDSTYTTEYVYE